MHREPQTHLDDGPFWSWAARADRALSIVEKLGMVIAALSILTLGAAMVAGVLLRPADPRLYSLAMELGGPVNWPLTYLGAAYIWRNNGHVQFDWMLGRLKGRSHSVAQIVGCLVSLAVAVMLTWIAWRTLNFYYRGSQGTLTMGIPYWYFYWTALAGLAVLSVEILFSALRHLHAFLNAGRPEFGVPSQ